MRLAGAIGPWSMQYRQRATDWWGGRSTREQRLLLALGVTLAIVLAVVLVVKPLQAARADALADIRTFQTLRTRILAAGPGFAAPVAVRRTGDPTSVLTSSAAAAGLTVAQAMGLSARIERQPFDAVVRWLDDLARTSDLRVRTATLTRTDAAGLVDGRLEFTR